MVDPLTLVPRPVDGADFHDIDDEVLALVEESLTRLTGTAARVLRACDGVRSVHDVAEAVRVSSSEVAEVLDSLAGLGLVELREPGPGVRYRKPDHVGACVDGEQVGLVDLRDGRQHALSASGAEIWLTVTATGSLEETIAELQQAFPGEGGLDAEAANFVDELVAAGLLERMPLRD